MPYLDGCVSIKLLKAEPEFDDLRLVKAAEEHGLPTAMPG